MIDIIGIKKMAVLGALLALNIVLAFVVYMNLTPQIEQNTRQLSQVRGQVNAKMSETDRIRREYAEINEKKSAFDNMQQAGYFSDQYSHGRTVQTRIELIQKLTDIISAEYNVSPIGMTETDDLKDAGYAIMESAVDIKLEAFDDVDVYNFVFWLQDSFPGHLSMKNMKIERTMRLNDVILRRIGSGIPTPLVTAQLGFVWRTVIKSPSTEGMMQ